MALVGIVRVSTQGQDIARQHDALDYLRDGDMLTVQEVDHPARNLREGLVFQLAGKVQS